MEAPRDTTELEPRLGLARDILDELRWTVEGRRGWLIGICINLIVGAFAVTYSNYVDTGDHLRVGGFATSLAAWVFADTINTNQLGADAHRVVASLARGDNTIRILVLKNLALLVLLAPLTIVLSTVLRLATGHTNTIAAAAISDMAVLWAWLGLGCIVSVVLPYRPIPLNVRLSLRSSWPRWCVIQGVPYFILFFVHPWILTPSVLIAHRLFGRFDHSRLPSTLTEAMWGLVVWMIGLTLAGAYSALVHDRFVRDLRRPT